MNLLPTYFPILTQHLPYISLGQFPSPIQKIDSLSETGSSSNSLFIKRDDISGSVYGGNKVRKLEFLLADAMQKGAKRIITSGAVGSNHALATALYGRQCGFKVTIMLFGEQFGEHVEKNLLADYASSAEMCYSTTYEEHLKALESKLAFYKERDSIAPYLIPAGGTSPLGVAGYLNAAFELKSQINKGEIPEPDTIFMPLGTMGSAIGLLMGLKAAKINSTLIAVQVVPSFVADIDKCKKLFTAANEYFHSLDKTFPYISLENTDFQIETNYLGKGYGIVTDEAKSSIKTFNKIGISLDGVYSGKTAAAMIHYLEHNESKTVLFWNTKNSIPLNCYKGNRSDLPGAFHRFFKSDAQS
jgi:D-cysteine desulfhydrase